MAIPYARKPAFFRNPVHCVKIANDGRIYVCDRGNDRLVLAHLSKVQRPPDSAPDALFSPGRGGRWVPWIAAPKKLRAAPGNSTPYELIKKSPMATGAWAQKEHERTGLPGDGINLPRASNADQPIVENQSVWVAGVSGFFSGNHSCKASKISSSLTGLAM